MEEKNYDEIGKEAGEAIRKDLQDIFHGDASRFIKDDVFFDWVIENRVNYWVEYYKNKYPQYQTKSGFLSWLNKTKDWLKNTFLKNKQTLPSKTNKPSNKIEFDSVEEAFLTSCTDKQGK